MKNSGIQGNFLKLAFLNSSNLYQIRHQCNNSIISNPS